MEESFAFGIVTVEDRINFFKKNAPDIAKSERFINYLSELGYFTAPMWSSSSEDSGRSFFEHSYYVTASFHEIVELYHLPMQQTKECFLIGMLHNLGKLNYLEKTENGLVWNDIPKMNAKEFGKESIQLIEKEIELTDEERACILWHKLIDSNNPSFTEYVKVIQKYPTAYALGSAEFIVSNMLEL